MPTYYFDNSTPTTNAMLQKSWKHEVEFECPQFNSTHPNKAAEKTITCLTAPPVLVLQIPRFATNEMEFEKDAREITVSPQVEISVKSQNVTYQLYGACVSKLSSL